MKNLYIFILLLIPIMGFSQRTLLDETKSIIFETGDTTLTKDREGSLQSYINSLKVNHERYKFTITGYKDNIGSLEF